MNRQLPGKPKEPGVLLTLNYCCIKQYNTTCLARQQNMAGDTKI